MQNSFQRNLFQAIKVDKLRFPAYSVYAFPPWTPCLAGNRVYEFTPFNQVSDLPAEKNVTQGNIFVTLDIFGLRLGVDRPSQSIAGIGPGEHPGRK